MSKQEEAERIIRSHVLWAMGGGLIPIPLVDIAAVTGIQLDMLKQLAVLHDVDYSASSGKAFISALSGSTFAALGSSLVKVIPGIGTFLGVVSMSALSGASTYAVGQVAVSYFGVESSLGDVDLSTAKKAYKKAFEKGKSFVSDLDEKKEEAADVFEKLEKLGKLKEQGVLSNEEFETKKKELLDRL